MRTLVLGIGNLLLGDEGGGVHAARALTQAGLPPNVKVLEIGTAFLDALAEIEQAERLIIIDAMQADQPPGTIYRIPFADCETPKNIASLHGFDLSRVLFLAGRRTPPEVVVIGIEPARVAWGTELSKTLRVALPELVAAVRAEVGSGCRPPADLGGSCWPTESSAI